MGEDGRLSVMNTHINLNIFRSASCFNGRVRSKEWVPYSVIWHVSSGLLLRMRSSACTSNGVAMLQIMASIWFVAGIFWTGDILLYVMFSMWYENETPACPNRSTRRAFFMVRWNSSAIKHVVQSTAILTRIWYVPEAPRFENQNGALGTKSGRRFDRINYSENGSVCPKNAPHRNGDMGLLKCVNPM